MRFVSVLIASFLAAGALCAQPASIGEQEAEHARQLLDSASLLDKAWGAYLAGRLHVDDLDRLLIEQFRQAAAFRDAGYHTDEFAFSAVLFDAAIEAGITVPAALLEPFEERWSGPVLILLARDTGGQDALLRFSGERSQNIVWLAANNLLFERKSQPWFAAILGAIEVTHKFTVTDPGELRGGVGGGRYGASYGDGMAAMPKGFPPVALYTLQDYAQKDSVPLAHGPRDVYCKRTIVPTDKQVGIGSSGATLDRDAIRIGYLAQLGHMPLDQAQSLIHSETHIYYADDESFARMVDQTMQVQEQGIRNLLRAIESDGLRAPAIHLRVVPEVRDERRTQNDPLPSVAPRDIDLD